MLLLLHGNSLMGKGVVHSCSLWDRLGGCDGMLSLSKRDLPEIKFFIKMDFIISIRELWENLSVVSQVVNQMLESLTISVQEYLVVNLLELMHTTEHFSKGAFWA